VSWVRLHSSGNIFESSSAYLPKIRKSLGFIKTRSEPLLSCNRYRGPDNTPIDAIVECLLVPVAVDYIEASGLAIRLSSRFGVIERSTWLTNH
jgi:hypothetical protein